MKVVHNAPSSNGYNAYCLSKEIIDLSVADVWDEAKMEWDLDHIVQLDPTEDVGQTCLCSHHPIFELCYIRNRLNGEIALVGNHCIAKFMEHLRSQAMFNCLRKIACDDTRSMNIELAQYAEKQGWLTTWEYKFVVDNLRRRDLSVSQLAIRQRLNDQVLRKIGYHHKALTKRRDQAIVDNLRQIKREPTTMVTVDTAQWLFDQHQITRWEYDFLLNIHERPRLSSAQQMSKTKVHAKIAKLFA